MAIKKREKSEVDFVNEIDVLSKTSEVKKTGKRNYKTVTIPLNQYEYELMSNLAEEYGQSINGIIRFALNRLQKETNKEN